MIDEGGVLRPLTPLPEEFKEHQRLRITIQNLNGRDLWLTGADPSMSLDAVRQGLTKILSTLSEAVVAEREDR